MIYRIESGRLLAAKSEKKSQWSVYLHLATNVDCPARLELDKYGFTTLFYGDIFVAILP